MPELPAMENFRRLIEGEALGHKISRVTVKKDRVVRTGATALTKALVGKPITAATRHGKYVFVRAGSGRQAAWLAFHCGMTGFFKILSKDDPQVEKAKLLLTFAGGGALAFFDPRRFGSVELIETPEEFIAAHALGPDAGAITAPQFTAALAASRKPLKGFFLDQSILAGIGNVYGDEIPFQAGLSPLRKANSVTAAEAARLYRAMKSVLKTAIAKKAYLDHWDMLPQSWLVHHREAGAPCPRCGGAIKPYKVGGRDGYWSPDCQT